MIVLKWPIGELAETAGVTTRTIRYYVSEGLLPPPAGSGANRLYGQEHLVRLRLIRRLQQEHLPLQEIRERLSRLSLAEMERLLEGAPPARRRVSARQLLAAVLAPQDAAGAKDEPALLRQMVPKQESPPGPAAGERLWRRVVLAPGVELFYQVMGDADWDAAVQQAAEEAATRLAAARWPGKQKGGG